MPDDQSQDSSVSPPPPAPISDQSADSKVLPVANRPEPTVSADSSQSSADSSIPSLPQTTHTESVSSIPSESPPLPTSLSSASETPISSPTLPNETNSANSPSESVTPILEEKPPESPSPSVDTNVSLSDNQPSQMQSGAPIDASKIVVEQITSQSAEIKLEPLRGFQEAPLADKDTQNSSPKSFGDLLSEANRSPTPPVTASPGPSIPSTPPSTPPISSSPPDLSDLSNPSDLPVSSSPNPQPTTDNIHPATSFGDLIKDIEITPPVLPEAERPVEQQPIQPSQSQPQTPSQISPASPPPQSPQSPTSPSNPPESQIIEKVVEKIVEKPVEVIKEVIKEIPVVDQAEVQKQTEGKLKERLTILQQKGNQKKKDKKQAILQRIVDIARTRGRINNQEAQKILHLPQSTLTDYFQELVSQGSLKKEGKGKATYYHL